MPTDLADVPAWLRFNARRWSMRILFLADELEMELERRAEFKRIAAAEGIRVIDIPRGLDHDELQAFITRNVTETPAAAPLAVGLGNVVGGASRRRTSIAAGSGITGELVQTAYRGKLVAGKTCRKCAGGGVIEHLDIDALEPEWVECPKCAGAGLVSSKGHVVNELVPPRPKRSRECECYSDDHCQACADDEPCTCDGCMP